MNAESRFQQELIKDLETMFPGCIILKNDPTYLQGVPDLTVLYGTSWAVLECKAFEGAPNQPNQAYYVEELGRMSYAAFVYPDNKDDILHELQLAFGTRRKARVSKCK